MKPTAKKELPQLETVVVLTEDTARGWGNIRMWLRSRGPKCRQVLVRKWERARSRNELWSRMIVVRNARSIGIDLGLWHYARLSDSRRASTTSFQPPLSLVSFARSARKWLMVAEGGPKSLAGGRWRPSHQEFFKSSARRVACETHNRRSFWHADRRSIVCLTREKWTTLNVIKKSTNKTAFINEPKINIEAVFVFNKPSALRPKHVCAN